MHRLYLRLALVLALATAHAAEPRRSSEETVVIVRVRSRDDGRVQAGARVSLVTQGEMSSSRYVEGPMATRECDAPLTDASGRAWIRVRPGVDYTVEVDEDDERVGRGESKVHALKAGERRQIVVLIPTEPDLVVSGQVVAQHDGAPVAGARVRIRVGTWDDSEHFGELETDARGAFALRVPSWREVVAYVEAEGFGLRIVELCTGYDTPRTPVTVPLSRASALELVVSDVHHAPLDGLVAWLTTGVHHLSIADENGDGPHVLRPKWSARLDLSGRARIEALPPEAPLALELWRDDVLFRRTREPVTLAAGETRTLTVMLGAGSRVIGRLVDARDGTPIAQHELWLEPAADASRSRYFSSWHAGSEFARTTTDPAGGFVFDDVEAGAWWIGPAPTQRPLARLDPLALAPCASVLDIALGGAEQHVLLEGHRGIYLSGRVLDGGGVPLLARVRCRSEAHGFDEDTRSNKTEHFEFGPLVPGIYELQVFVANEQAPVLSRSVDSQHAGELVLDLRSGAKLTGVLSLDAERVARTATVFLVPRSASAGDDWQCKWLKEQDGAHGFTFSRLQDGKYDLHVTTALDEYGSVRDLDVRFMDAALHVPIELHPGAVLELESRSAVDWRVVQVLHDGHAWDEVSIRDESLERVVVPPGVVELRVLDQEGVLLEQRILQLVRGEVASVTLP